MGIGVPSYAARKRHIEDLIAQFIATLRSSRAKLVQSGAARDAIERALRERAERLDLAQLNGLIDRHNRYFPIEANLPIDPATGGYLLVGRPWQKEEPWDVARLLASLEALEDHEPR